ncbi:unnamed protein product [Musa textilis]
MDHRRVLRQWTSHLLLVLSSPRRPDALCCLLLHRVDRFVSVPNYPISSRSIIIGFLYLGFSRVLRFVLVCSFIFFDWTPRRRRVLLSWHPALAVLMLSAARLFIEAIA